MHLERSPSRPQPALASHPDETPWCDPPPEVAAVLAAGVRSSRLVFPENAPPRRVEQWQAPVVVDAALSARLLAYLSLVERATAAAERGALLARVLALLSHFRMEPHPPTVEALLADDWAEDLGGYPLWAVEEAARQWRRTRRFRPQICEIVALCDAACADRLQLRARLREVVATSAAAGRPLARRTASLVRTTLQRLPADPGD